MKISLTIGAVALVAMPLLPITAEKSADVLSAGGLTELPSWTQVGDNLLKNSSFEEITESGELSGWEIRSPNVFRSTDNVAHTGNRSLLLRNSHQHRTHTVAAQTVELVPGWYRLSAWVKAQEAGTNQAGSGARVTLQWQAARVSTDPIGGTTDWIELEREMFPAPAGRAHVRLEGYRKPNGSLFFDDVVLQRRVPPILEAFLLFPNYRGLLFADGSQKIRVSVSVSPREAGMELSDLTVELSLSKEGVGQPIVVEQLLPRETDFVMEINAADLSLGPYDLKLRALRSRDRSEVYAYPSYRIVKLPAETKDRFHIRVDSDNALVVEGTRKFALGIYDTTGYSNSEKAYEERISKISEAPLNLYINYWLGRAPNSAISALARTLRKHGMYYLHTVNTWYEDNKRWPRFPECGRRPVETLGQNDYTACRAKELGSMPGMAGWYTADERPADQARRVFHQYRVLRESDPAGITFIAQNNYRELLQWRDAADVFDLHQYPIFNVAQGEVSPLNRVYEQTRAAVEAVEGSRPVWAVIQYFRHGAKGHWPTYDELRSMSYMAIVAGAKGLLYWSYGAKGLSWVKDPKEREELWQRLVTLTKEIQSLEAVLLSADEPRILEGPPSSDAIRTLEKQSGVDRYLIAVNLSSQEVRANFTLSAPVPEVTVVGENRAIPVDSRTFLDRFAPYEAHLYRMPASL